MKYSFFVILWVANAFCPSNSMQLQCCQWLNSMVCRRIVAGPSYASNLTTTAPLDSCDSSTRVGRSMADINNIEPRSFIRRFSSTFFSSTVEAAWINLKPLVAHLRLGASYTFLFNSRSAREVPSGRTSGSTLVEGAGCLN